MIMQKLYYICNEIFQKNIQKIKNIIKIETIAIIQENIEVLLKGYIF